MKTIEIEIREETVTLEISYEMEDNGIGAYECHGVCGTQVAMEVELKSAWDVEAKKDFDLDDLTADERDRAEEAAARNEGIL